MFSKGRHRRPSRTAGIVTGTAGASLAGAAIITAAPAAHAAIPPPPSTGTAQVLPARAVADTIRAAQPLTVTVQDGDTLSEIALKHCGNPADWTGIYEANKGKIKDYNLIYKDQVFILACKTAYVPQPVVQASAVTYSPRKPATREAPAQSPAGGNVSTAGMGGFQACVIRAESGGNPGIWNASGHWGLYQFSASTWAGHGGDPALFGKASAAYQTQIFWNTVRADGTSDWAPYDGC